MMGSQYSFNVAAATPTPCDALKRAYEAAVQLFDWIDIPAFNFTNDQDGFTALLLIYQEQYTQETNLRQSVDRYAEDLRVERTSLRTENQALKTEVEELKSELLKSRQRMEDESKSAIKAHRAEFSELEIAQSQSFEEHEQMNDQLKSEVAGLKLQVSQCNELIKELEGKVTERNSTITVLESRIAQLDLLEPLVQLGSATRLRCLEKSRVKLEGCARNKLANSVIEKGNAAAHHGHGDADSALLHSGVLPPGSATKYSRIFARMYQSNFSSWPSLPQKMKDALNCVATLNGLEAFGHLPNAAACGPIIDHVDMIREKYKAMAVEEFNVNEVVSQRLKFAKSLTEQIVKTERQSKPLLGGRSTRSKFPSIPVGDSTS